jgi:hypothetical protein
MNAVAIKAIPVDLSVSQPVRLEFHALTKLNESEKAIIKASCGVKIKDIDSDTVFEKVGEMIKNIHLRLGYTKQNEDLIAEQQWVIVGDLMTYHRLLTFEELKIVIDHALAGEYSSEVFFAPAYLMQWIKKYLERKEDANKKHTNYLNASERKKPIPTQEEMDAVMEGVVLEHFKRMSEDNKGVYEECIIDYGGVLFEFLERKHTQLSKERKFEIYNLCLERFPNKPHEEIIKKCKSVALIEMLRISHSRHLNSI